MAEEKPTLILEKDTSEEQAAEAVASKEEIYYQIGPGETLESIAEKFQTTPEAILERNNFHPNDIRFGYWIFV